MQILTKKQHNPCMLYQMVSWDLLSGLSSRPSGNSPEETLECYLNSASEKKKKKKKKKRGPERKKKK